jgi:dienelactone hydrolase
MHFTSERLLDAADAAAAGAAARADSGADAVGLAETAVVEREFTLDGGPGASGIPGILWTPASATGAAPVPLILLGHPSLGLPAMYPRLVARARHAAADGFASAAVELPGCGDRPRLPSLDRARDELQRTLRASEPVTDALIDDLVLPLVEAAVPETRAALDALLALPEIDGPVGYSGGVISLATRLAVVEPRIEAAVLFAGSLLPRATFDDARQVTVPLHVLLQWDDERNDRQASLDLFDAFGSAEKSLHAHMGGHTGVPHHAGEAASRFFTRHLK